MAIPIDFVELVDWSNNFNTRINAQPATYGTTAPVAAQYTDVHDPFILAHANVVAALESGTRSKPLSVIRSAARQALLDFARPLYKMIQANTLVSDAAKVELGIVLPSLPQPIPAPGSAPIVRIVQVDGRVVRATLRHVDFPDDKRLPPGIDGAIWMSYVGPTAPTDPTAFKMEGPTSRMVADIVFPESAAPGTQVWLSAVWFNERKMMGPAALPAGTVINYGGSLPMVG